MRRRHALVVHTRMPAFDRDSGSQDVDNMIRFLLRAGWRVSFISREEEGVAEERHAARLRSMGVATYAGFGWAERVCRSSTFDLAVIAFWELAATVAPVVRAHSPGARIVVNSMDVHFLRKARYSFSNASDLDDDFARDTARELNAYHGADAVLAVSDKERTLLADFLGEERTFTLPIAEEVGRSPVPLAERRGMYFVGNFRHVPNREAVAYLVNDVLPLVDPALLAEHPLTVVGNWLDKVDIGVDPATPGVHLLGWVPTIQPFMERSRLAVVPLLHGAGVKRKVIQAMMAGTPVVTTPVGAEGLDLVQNEHALVAADADDLAAGLTRLLTDDALWTRLAEQGAAHVDDRHGIDHVEQRFGEIVEQVLARPPRAAEEGGDGGGKAPGPGADRAAGRSRAIRERIQVVADPGAVVLVASGGDESLVELGSHPCWHFPQGRDGGWAGYDPADGRAAVTHLESQRERGAGYFALPKEAFGWRHRYPELHEHLETTYRRVHQDEHVVLYDLAGPGARAVLDEVPAARVLVLGTYPADRAGPSPGVVAELGSSARHEVEQRWEPAAPGAPRTVPDDADADVVVLLDDGVVLPSRFLDDLVATQLTLGADRLQPCHVGGPDAGPPVTERHRGSVAREVDDVTSLPVLAVRAGAAPTGPVVLADEVTVGLRRPLDRSAGDATSYVRRIWVTDAERRPTPVARPEPATTPRISVLIATYERGELLYESLASFADQTLDAADYEVVVVDDGSHDSVVDTLVEKFAGQMQVFAVRIAHAGRSAAKNHALLLARAPIVLFFDDDDRAAPDYLERHLLAHAAHPGDHVAVLGHTDWAPELEPTPLSHYITDVDRLMFAYERLRDGQELDWRGFWEGRISCKRALLARHGLHDQRLNYSIDVEMGWRLARHGLRIVYDASARSSMARPVDFEGFCRRTQAKGRAQAVIAALHPGTAIAAQFPVAKAIEHWNENRFGEAKLRGRVLDLERAVADRPSALPDLHDAYRAMFRLLHAKGMAETTEGASPPSAPPTTVQPFPGTDPELAYDGTPPGAPTEPLLSITLPVWSRSPELAEMARRTIDRIWEVARVPTEVVVVDNGSPYEVPLAARVYRYPENKGVATGWNAGIRLSRAPAFVVLNSDCRVEPGWDEALYEAVNDGRRIAFPYTDHCDGRGFELPDQGGTAGWCFMMTKAVHAEVGVFDEWFNPAFLEDTDYWHRAWELGIELSPVPAARVVHARRTTAGTHPRVEWLLQAHRYKYGWKHGVDPHRAPPYYNREIQDYVGTVGRRR